ncbi:uncharacterized protein LOC120347519 [Styela clava]
MKLFRSRSSRRKRNGDITATDEFTFHMPSQFEDRRTQLEIECFKKRREINRPESKNVIRKHINSIDSLKSDGESDYESMPRVNENELCSALDRFRLHDTLSSSSSNDSKFSNQSTPSYTGSEEVNSRLQDTRQQVFPDNSPSNWTSTEILLFPEEEWARNAKKIQWTIKFSRCWENLCIVTERSVGGSYMKSAEAKVIRYVDGSLSVIGRFQRLENPDFELHLSTACHSDLQNGYVMTGHLLQGNLSLYDRLDITHFAAITREQ